MAFYSNRTMHRGRTVTFKPSGPESASSTHRTFDTGKEGGALYVEVKVSAVNVTATVTARVASTANLTLNDEQTIDTVAVVAGDVVLVKNQTDAKANGLYTVVAEDDWTRTDDELGGLVVGVTAGSAGAGKVYVQTTAAPAVGTDDIAFSLASPGTLGVVVEGCADGTNWFTLGSVGGAGYVAGTATAPTAFSSAGTVRAAFPSVQRVRTRSTVTNTVTYSVTGVIG